jgi:hypothetical protein
MGSKLTRPYHAGAAGATSIASAEILFSDTEQEIVVVPAGAVVIHVWAQVLAAFNAGTTNVLTAGVTGTVDKYLAAADVNEAAVGGNAAKGPFAVEAIVTSVKAFYAQTGTAATTGKARVFVELARLAANG